MRKTQLKHTSRGVMITPLALILLLGILQVSAVARPSRSLKREPNYLQKKGVCSAALGFWAGYARDLVTGL